MRAYCGIQPFRSAVAAAWLGLAVGMLGCQQGAAPEGELAVTFTEEAPAEDYAAANPLSENEFDPGVVTTAGELPAKPVKGQGATIRGAGRPLAPRDAELDEEMAEELEELDDDSELADIPEPKVGTPEYLLRQIAVLKATPTNIIRQPIPGKPGEFEAQKLTPEQAAKEPQRRLHVTIDLAMQVIATTKDQPKQQQLFNNAVHYLTDARKQLAIAGESDQGQLLADDAAALFKRDKTSFAAVQSALKVVQLAQAQAEAHGRKDPRWGSAFAKQARLFTEQFPQETNLAAMNLLTAGRICEQLDLTNDALQCYTAVEERYPGTPFADTTTGVLRRMRLPGQKLTEFGGSTLEGGFISIDQFAGHPVLIAFWSANSQNFQTDLPVIEAALAKHSARGLMVIGVNMDKDQGTVDRFVEQHSLTWQTIFHSPPESRGVHSPLARHYGVTSVPMYWLVDSRGTVVAAPFDVQQLDAVLSKTPTNKTPTKSAQR